MNEHCKVTGGTMENQLSRVQNLQYTTTGSRLASIPLQLPERCILVDSPLLPRHPNFDLSQLHYSI